MKQRNILLEIALVNALYGILGKFIFFVLAQEAQVAVLVFIPNGRVRLRAPMDREIARVIQYRVLAVAQENTTRLLRIGLTDASLVLVLLVQEQDLKHHLDSGRLVEVKVKLLKYLELCFHEHLRNKLYIRLFVAELGGLLEIKDAVLVHFHSETEANAGDKSLHRWYDQALVHEQKAVEQLDGVQSGYVIKTVNIFNLEYPMEDIDSILSHDAHFLQKILLDLLIRAVLVGINISRLLDVLGILDEFISIGFDVVAEGLLRIFSASLQPKLNPAKKLSIRSQFLANLLIEVLLT